MALEFLLLCYLLFHQFPLRSLASNPGTLALFLDEECSEASVINPSVNIPVDTCLVTHGALGIAVEELPPCSSGDATLVLYRDTSCANPVNSDLQYNNCYFDGPNGVPAVLFACGGAAATATSTISAGSSTIPVAADTPSSTSSGATTQQTTPSSNGAATASTSSSSSTSPNSSPTNTNSNGTGSGLSQKAEIELGIILPVGAILVAVLAWWFPCKKG